MESWTKVILVKYVLKTADFKLVLSFICPYCQLYLHEDLTLPVEWFSHWVESITVTAKFLQAKQ
jgi:hypothetical protein